MPDPQVEKTLEDLKTKITQLEAETSLIQAQKARLEAQQGLASATDPLKLAAAQAESTKTLAESWRDTFKALRPQTEALAGSTTFDDKVLIGNEILAYREIADLANKIAEKVAAAVPKAPNDENRAVIANAAPKATVVIHLDEDIKALLAYRQVVHQIDMLRKEFEAISSGAQRVFAPTSVVPVAAALGAAVDVVGLLRENLAYTGTTVQVSDVALVSLVAAGLKTREIDVIYPPLLTSAAFAKESAVMKQIGALGDARETAHKSAGAKPAEDPLRKRLGRAEEAYTALVGARLKTDDKGATPLGTLLRAEAIEGAGGGNAPFLSVKVVAAGGTNRARQSIWFWRGGGAHSGGAIVAYALVARSGVVLDSGLLHGWSGYYREPSDQTVENSGFLGLFKKAKEFPSGKGA